MPPTVELGACTLADRIGCGTTGGLPLHERRHPVHGRVPVTSSLPAGPGGQAERLGTCRGHFETLDDGSPAFPRKTFARCHS